MQVKYLAKRDTHRRILDQAAVTNLGLGLTLAEPLVFEAANGFTLEMDDGACDTLVNKLPDEFVAINVPVVKEVVKEEAGNPPADNSLDESGEADLEGSPDESPSPAAPAVTRSSQTRKPKR